MVISNGEGRVVTRAQLAALWDEVVATFLEGGSPVPPAMSQWHTSVRGTGTAAVDTSCFPEPYIGDLLGDVRAVVLGLNPGRPFPALQSRNGVYASAIRQYGSYRAWAATWPYLSRAWTDAFRRPNTFHVTRYQWVCRWLDERLPPSRSHVVMELYPWHSTNLPSPFRPSPAAIEKYVWEPLADLGPVPTFAFGSTELFDTLPRLPGVEVLARLPRPGESAATYGFSAKTRQVLIGRTPAGGLLYVANHAGSDKLPPLAELRTHQSLAHRFG